MKPLSIRGRGRAQNVCWLIAAGVLLSSGSRPALGQTLYIRQDISRLTSAQIETLRRGIATMMSRSASDPTSWAYQTNIHGTASPTPSPLNTCQHGSYYFLAWHRMYLYYFERILRRASGDPTFALPYWNYGDPNQRALPLPYRQPANATTNPLYVTQREMNDGSLLPASAVSVATAFAATNFSSPPGSGQSFGGQRLLQPSHNASPPGLLERNPHNTIHVLIGGSSGWMADVATAARDPIFWLHHANIDRLWKRWLDQGGGRANPPPSDTAWRGTSFTFINENGQQVVLTGAQILNTVTQLGYRYDDDPAPVALATPEPPAAPAPGPNDARALGAPPRLPEFVAMHDRGINLDLRQPVRVVVPLDNDNEAASRIQRILAPAASPTPGASGAGAERLMLNLDHIEYDRPPGVYWEIYVNLPERERNPDPQGPNFVGTLALFGMKPHAGETAHILQDIDITDVLRKLALRRPRRLDRLSVTFVPRGPLPPPSRPAPPSKSPPSLPRVRIGLLTLTIE